MKTSHSILAQKLLKSLFTVAVFVGLLSFLSCSKAPVYPNTPSISVSSLRFERNVAIVRTGSGQLNDTADYFFLTINYQDGDGDLGLDETDTSGVYARYKVTGGLKTTNPNYFNFFPDLYEAIKPTDEFRLYPFPTGTNLNGRFARISTDDRSEPVKGTIEYKIRITRKLLPKGRRYKFKVFIQDRSLNHSDTITTPEVVAE